MAADAYVSPEKKQEEGSAADDIEGRSLKKEEEEGAPTADDIKGRPTEEEGPAADDKGDLSPEKEEEEEGPAAEDSTGRSTEKEEEEGSIILTGFDLGERFGCCICLELLCEPVVIACGHMLCFWCAHRSMHIIRHSECPLCKGQYSHLPSICGLIRSLLTKLQPVEYKRREKEVLEREKVEGEFSSELTDFSKSKNSVEKDGEGIVESDGSMNPEKIRVDMKKVLLELEDMSCPLCGELLYEPSVLNCGHVYCLSCLSSLGKEAVTCILCGSHHPGGSLAVCWDLDVFLKEYFPAEYTARRESVQQNVEGSFSGNSRAKESTNRTCARLGNIHVGVGCDSCGTHPIRGKRFRCMECTELMGFDLCEECYNKKSTLPGRFNQQHTPDHVMEPDDSLVLQRVLNVRETRDEGLEEVLDYYLDMGEEEEDSQFL